MIIHKISLKNIQYLYINIENCKLYFEKVKEKQ